MLICCLRVPPPLPLQWRYGRQRMSCLLSDASRQHALCPAAAQVAAMAAALHQPASGGGCTPHFLVQPPQELPQPHCRLGQVPTGQVSASACPAPLVGPCRDGAPAGQVVAVQLWCVAMSCAVTVHVREACCVVWNLFGRAAGGAPLMLFFRIMPTCSEGESVTHSTAASRVQQVGERSAQACPAPVMQKGLARYTRHAVSGGPDGVMSAALARQEPSASSCMLPAGRQLLAVIQNCRVSCMCTS